MAPTQLFKIAKGDSNCNVIPRITNRLRLAKKRKVSLHKKNLKPLEEREIPLWKQC
ncbi:MAG: hypothetical protein N3F66_07710 [Spirochaetes bacterium]|nr:hypothetical protein [Spirochaetota bacterium]